MRAPKVSRRVLVHVSLVLGVGAFACSSQGGDSDSVEFGTTTGGAATATGGVAAGTGGVAGTTGGAPAAGGAPVSTGGLRGTGGETTVVATPICATAEEETSATLTCPAGSTITSIDFA